MKIRSIFSLTKKLVTVDIKGGLGNQLFQIAAVLNYAKTFNHTPVFNKNKQLHDRQGDVGGYTYWDIFNTTNLLKLEDLNKIKFREYREEKFCFTPFTKINKNVILNGYFQSPKYVDLVKPEMQELLWSNINVNQKVNESYQKIKSHFNTEDLISIHVRRGDYLNLSTFHTNLELDYYVAAINMISKTAPIIVFSNDQDWCKDELSKHIGNPLFFVNDADYIELLLMSKIKHNIIANSSFSWWSTYLNEHKDKSTIAPKQWFGPDGIKDWNDIYETNWIKI